MEKAKVYFSKTISVDQLVKMFKVLNKKLKGNVAIKVHSGEAGNQNYLRPEFIKKLVEEVGGTIVECNTAYEGARNTTEKHEQLMKDHKWTDYFSVDILDSEEPDMVLPIKNGSIIKENYVGKNIKNYDSMLVVSHFKGHPMGGYGGALKQLSIGVASSRGKCWIHSGGKTLSQKDVWNKTAEQNEFLEAMAEAASSVTDYFKDNIAYINIMCNMSVDCDCCASAEDPCLKDIGILSSLDPVALDQACIDLVYNSNDKGKEHFIERVESRNGIHIIEKSSTLKIGSREYELIEID